MVAIVSAVEGGGGKGDVAPSTSTDMGPVRQTRETQGRGANPPSFKVRIRIPRSLPHASAILRAASVISPRVMTVLRVGSFGDKPRSVDRF